MKMLTLAMCQDYICNMLCTVEEKEYSLKNKVVDDVNFVYEIFSGLQTVLSIGKAVSAFSQASFTGVFCLSRLLSFLGVSFEGLSCISQL